MKRTLRNAMMMLLASAPFVASSQTRYAEEVFDNSEISIETGVVYASNIDFLYSNFQGANTLTDIGTLSAIADAGGEFPAAYYNPLDESTDVKLKAITMDVYAPSSDVDDVTERPVIIYLHTGDFLPTPINGSTTGLMNDSSAVALCKGWARRGFVAISVDYRLGWNPIASTVQERRGTLLNAVYRAIHDLKASIRYVRNSAINGDNPFGVDETRIVVYGQGSGGYVAQAAATLNQPEELFLEKFRPNPFDETVSYIDTLQVGTIAGFGFQNSLNLYRESEISAEFHMSINAGGALADESWLEAGDVPMCAINCVRDDFAPFDQGTVIVPTTQEEVVDVHGANFFIQKANQLGNNDVFVNIPDGDPYTDAARALYGTTVTTASAEGSVTINTEVEGLFPLIRPLRPFLANESGPWEWWDPTSPIAQYEVAPGITAHMASLNSNPDMSPEKGMTYVDSIQGYIVPRIMCALDLPEAICSTPDAVEEVSNTSFKVYPNPANDRFMISSNEVMNSVVVFDITGKMVASRNAINVTTLDMNVSELPTGVYLVQVSTDKARMTQRLIVE
ncbi:MAG: T9SS type A sorting domain-containing protein [Flavobacteriales bacterium]